MGFVLRSGTYDIDQSQQNKYTVVLTNKFWFYVKVNFWLSPSKLFEFSFKTDKPNNFWTHKLRWNERHLNPYAYDEEATNPNQLTNQNRSQAL